MLCTARALKKWRRKEKKREHYQPWDFKNIANYGGKILKIYSGKMGNNSIGNPTKPTGN